MAYCLQHCFQFFTYNLSQLRRLCWSRTPLDASPPCHGPDEVGVVGLHGVVSGVDGADEEAFTLREAPKSAHCKYNSGKVNGMQRLESGSVNTVYWTPFVN